MRALVARLGSLAVGTVDSFGEEARQGGLAGATWPGEEVGLTDSAKTESVRQGGDNVFLADHGRESLWTVFAVKSVRGHRGEILGIDT